MERPSPLAYAELLHLEGCLWVLTAPAGVPNYDFRFDFSGAPREDGQVFEVGAVGNEAI